MVEIHYPSLSKIVRFGGGGGIMSSVMNERRNCEQRAIVPQKKPTGFM